MPGVDGWECGAQRGFGITSDFAHFCSAQLCDGQYDYKYSQTAKDEERGARSGILRKYNIEINVSVWRNWI